MDPKKLAYQNPTVTVNTYLVNTYVDTTVDLLAMQSSRGQDMLSHSETQET